uniref:TSC22 domain family member 4 n=1 Tax=Latimeria chalumnae TaxID=7897 RepID=H3AYG6_LATCH
VNVQSVSVKSMISSYESRAEPRHGSSAGRCSRGASPTRGKMGAEAQQKNAGAEKLKNAASKRVCNRNIDKHLLALLVFLHSGSSNSMIAIDNKIEQAMDLVKSHLMYAVREEVEVLKEQIKELIERNSALEQENCLLKSLVSPEQLSQVQSQAPKSAAPPGAQLTSTTSS